MSQIDQYQTWQIKQTLLIKLELLKTRRANSKRKAISLDDSIINENKVKSIARHEIEMELEDVMIISKALLKNEGSLVLVHRTDRLIEIIELMKKHNIEPKRMRLIYPKVNMESNLVLIEGRKNGKEGLKILPPLYIHNDDSSYTSEVLEMFGKW